MNTKEFLVQIGRETNSLLCFGIDPVLDRIPLKKGTVKERIVNFFIPIIDILIERKIISAIKPNIAYFSQYGNEGLSALKEIIDKYGGELPIILDAKRGDIGRSSGAYAKELYDVWNVNAITVHPYMGIDSVRPFLREGKLTYLLVKTSNPSSIDFQDLDCSGKKLYQWVEQKAEKWKTGMVVGATVDAKVLNKMFMEFESSMPLLIPGIGAQGGSLENVAFMIKHSKANRFVHRINVSSGIAYAYEKCEDKSKSPMDSAIESAEEFKQMINNAIENYIQNELDNKVGNNAFEFIDFLVKRGALKFGNFTLKSGRKSPYFVKMDVFSDGESLLKLADFYAGKILKNAPDVEAIYGPAYKGIPLGVAVTLALNQHHGKNVIYCSDRKEEKTHGDKGKFLGGNISNKKVVIVDDVMTTGETKIIAIEKIKRNFENVDIKGVFIAVDREEKWKTDLASREFEKETGIHVYAVTNISDVFGYLHNRSIGGKTPVNDKVYSMYKEYKSNYGMQGVTNK